MFDTAAVGIGIMSLDRKLMDANPALCQMFGMPRDELIGQMPVVVTYPGDYEASTQQFMDLISGNVDSFWGERRYQRKNGEVFWAHVTMSLVRNEKGKPLYIIGMLVDIDERKRAMLELNESAERFRAIFDSTAIGLGLLRLDGKILRVNAAVCQMSGYTEEELKQRYDYENVYPEDREIGHTEFTELVSGKRVSFEIERRYVRKNGEVFWSRLSFAPVHAANGKPLYLVGIIEDIDGQKKVFTELQQSEARFRAIFENSAIGMSLVGLDRQPVEVNPAISRLSGYSREEYIKKNTREIVHPDDVNIGDAEFQELLDGKRDSYQIEKRFLRKQGGYYCARQTISGVRGPDGKPQFIVSMTEDITEQKKAQQNLQESEARFRAMFDHISIGMTLMSLDWRILAANQMATRILGYTLDELMDLDPAKLTLPEDQEIGMTEFRDLVAGRRDSMQIEKRNVRKNGESFWARIAYALVRQPDGRPQYLVGSIEDINEQKLAADKLAAQEAEYRRTLEQRVQERTRELEETNLRLVGEVEQRRKAEAVLASKAAEEAITAERTRLARDLHDAVTQTLFSASLIAEILPELWQIDPDEARKSNEELRQLTRGALAEMRTLLLELRPAALTQARFPDLLRQLSEAVIGRARLSVNLTVEGDYELPPDVKVTFYRIAQESLNNIVKYARATQVEIRIRLDCCNVHLEIHDNGCGFDLAAVKPTSLGMRIMRERAEVIHAHFQVASSPGQGTTVCVDWNKDELTPIANLPTRGEP